MFYEDEMDHVEDIDSCIEQRKQLIEEAKEIETIEDSNEAFRKVTDLSRKWKRITYWESAYEDSLREEFDGYLDAFYKKRNELYGSNEEVKQALADEAKKLASSKDWKHATRRMKEMMDEWKAVGTAGRELDDELWEEFNGARQKFYDAKAKNWEEMQERFVEAKAEKEQLIEEVKQHIDSVDFDETSKVMNDLMAKWKAVGSAGREHEEKLWEEFNGIRQQFYDRRSEHQATLREEFDKNLELKKELVDKAAAILDEQRFTREQTEAMKALNVEWKEIGFAGENENKLWKQLRGIMDAYFDGLKGINEQRQADWLNRMQDIRASKVELIQKQKSQIQYMENEIVGLIGERAIEDMKADIEDKHAFIEELENEIKDIDQQLDK